jgi:hypothetical protein
MPRNEKQPELRSKTKEVKAAKKIPGRLHEYEFFVTGDEGENGDSDTEDAAVKVTKTGKGRRNKSRTFFLSD